MEANEALGNDRWTLTNAFVGFVVDNVSEEMARILILLVFLIIPLVILHLSLYLVVGKRGWR